MFDYIDIHSHIYFPEFDTDREDEIQKLKDARVATITIGTDFDSSQKAVEMAEKHKHLFACVGQHPGDIDTHSDFDVRLLELTRYPKVVAIGECGLDYFRLEGGIEQIENIKSLQKKIFQTHVDLALSCAKPLMLHVRSRKGTMDAYEDTLEILEAQAKISGERLRGNVHCFVGSPDILKRFLAIGFTVSFTGIITFTHDYDNLVRETPLDMMMSETDAPFLTPIPYRGQRNSPLYVSEVVRAIARIRGEDFETIRSQMVTNALRVFNI